MSSDRIERTILLQAPLARAWSAISDARQFGSWFGVQFEGPFVAGRSLKGRIVPTSVDPEVAKMQQPYEGTAFEILVERIEPVRLFAFRWHPYAVEPGVDWSKEPMTLVEFRLEPSGESTHLTITESGFERLPAARRIAAFNANEGGWTHQTQLIQRYLAHSTR